MEFWISVLLTILGYLSGVLYAVYVICFVEPHRHRDEDDYVSPDQWTDPRSANCKFMYPI
jgi:hypothetical protein